MSQPASKLSRRRFIQLAGLGAGAWVLGACNLVQPRPATPPQLPSPTVISANGEVTLDLTAAPATMNLLPGQATRVWQYQGQLTQGDSGAMQAIPDSYLGPVLRLKRGQLLSVNFHNQIPDPSIVHWHGLSVPAVMDGHPRYAVAEGQSYNYAFQVINRVGTYWYHPHPDGRTGPQAYYGLAGMLIVSDDEEAALGLPTGEFDLPLVIQDRAFDGQNQWVYVANTMTGFFGDQVIVNGQAPHPWQLQARPYRLRLLNGSNARTYKLAWSDGTAFTVIGTDGGLLASPVQRPYLTLAPGERVELWADFSGYAAGQTITLTSQAFSAGGGMMGGIMGGGGVPNGAALEVQQIQVQAASSSPSPKLPAHLVKPNFYLDTDAVNQTQPRQITLAMGMTGTLNGRSFAMEEVADDEKVRLGDLELWEFYNAGGMGMMGGQPHPMHIHGGQFQVVRRQIDAAYQAGYQQVSAGFVDEGWKDTVLVWPGERVQVLMRFENYPGLYLYHCHILEHEDGGMMRNYQVES